MLSPGPPVSDDIARGTSGHVKTTLASNSPTTGATPGCEFDPPAAGLERLGAMRGGSRGDRGTSLGTRIGRLLFIAAGLIVLLILLALVSLRGSAPYWPLMKSKEPWVEV